MDWFPQVYDAYYKDAGKKPDFQFSDALTAKIGKGNLNEDARFAVKIVGVWDTVEFHGEGWGGEKIEFHNAELSKKVMYGYHALSLDERRVPYTPTLWQWPRDPNDNKKLYQPLYKKGLQEMKQVWFSGVHGDIGGGRYDPAGCDITLAWMLAQCSKDKKLAFIDEDPDEEDDYYLLDEEDYKTPNTNTTWNALHHKFQPEPSSGLVGNIMSKMQELALDDRRAWPMERTFERIHRSIRDRKFQNWDCGMLTGDYRKGTNGRLWKLRHGGGKDRDELPELEKDPVADEIENRYIGRVRALPGVYGGPAM
jgi:hypothetical protein